MIISDKLKFISSFLKAGLLYKQYQVMMVNLFL